MIIQIVRGHQIVCGVEAGEAQVVDDGAVVVQSGSIVAVGAFSELAPKYPGGIVVGGTDKIVFPGLVDAHHHLGVTPVQHGSPDLPLELWIVDLMGARSVDPHLDTLYSAFELARSGVTTVQHLPYPIPGSTDDVYKGAAAMIAAYKAIGMRVSYGQSVTDQNHIVYGDDEQFISGLPSDLQPVFRDSVVSSALTIEQSTEIFARLAEQFTDDPLVAIQLAPDNLHWCSDTALETVRDLSATQGVPMHMHLLETPYQKAYAHKRCGHSPVEHLREIGLLSPALTLGHGVWTTKADLELLSETGVRICHNCSSNQRLRSGTAPLNAMLEHGIEVALGIDEAGINDDRDMLQELRMVLRAHRVPGIEARVPSPAEVFQMASEYGARTTGFGDQIGVLKPGRAADLVIVDYDRLRFPYLDADVPIVDALVQRARTGDVHSVMVGGELIIEDGEFTKIDEQGALDELAASLRVPLSDAELERRRVTRAARPYVEAFYRHYLDGIDCEPFYRTNSQL